MERPNDSLELEPVDEQPEAAEPRVTEHDVDAIEQQDIRDEERTEGAEPYFAPTDPVMSGSGEIIGGFEETSMDDLAADPSTIDEEPGDEAIADAVRRELREDAATCHLALSVEVRRGVVYLRGAADLEDTDNAADVASRVAGVRQVVDQIATRGA